jgi:carboxyl-terminal processing protease
VRLSLLAILWLLPPTADAQLGPLDRGRAQDMLAVIKDDIKKHYYDPGYRGFDLDGEFRAADSMLREAETFPQMFGIIARTVLNFQDSHTLFLPPSTTMRVRYGWKIQMVGDSCFVTGVAPGSDADGKGLLVGDRVLSIQGIEPGRELLARLDYVLYSLNPRETIRFEVQSPGAPARELLIGSRMLAGHNLIDLHSSSDVWALIRRVENLEELRRNMFVEVDSMTLVWRLSGFQGRDLIDDGLGRARKFSNLILDLRGNGGGSEDVMLHLLGRLVEAETVVDTLRSRGEIEVKTVRPAGGRFAGKLIVLIDSESGSASEIVARVMQLEQRGTVIGDRSRGAVMRSRLRSHESGTQIVIFYALNVTVSDVVMRDGERLEGVGVMPDVLALPSGADLAAGRDPALGEALRHLGYPVPRGGVKAAFPPHPLEIESW